MSKLYYIDLKKEISMDDYNAIGIAEGFIEADSEEHYISAWQHLIDTGIVWSLQGWFGRTAMAMIESGHCNANR